MGKEVTEAQIATKKGEAAHRVKEEKGFLSASKVEFLPFITYCGG